MKTPPNIDRFNRVSLAIFRELYLAFPVPTNLNVNSLVMSAVPDDAAFDVTWDALEVGGAALDFLASEGLISMGQSYQDGSEYLQVRLTMKGLSVLGAVPSSIEHKESLISQVLAVSAKGLKDAATEKVQELAGHAFTFALASAPTITAMSLLGRP